MRWFSTPQTTAPRDTIESLPMPGVALRLFPTWYLLTPGGEHLDMGDTFLSATLRGGRLNFAFQFEAVCDLLPDTLVRVEFPELGCARVFALAATVYTDDSHVVAGHVDLKSALPKLLDGKVEKLA